MAWRRDPIYPTQKRDPEAHPGIAAFDFQKSMSSVCDICGKKRNGSVNGKRISHARCSKIRQQKGFH